LPYLLDTNTVSYLMQKRSTIVGHVARVGGVNNLRVAAITVAELRLGVELMPEGRKKGELLANLDAALLGLEVLPFTQDAAAAFGWAAALLRKEGVAWGWPDLAIASVGLAEHMTVVSNDGFFKHVECVCGLKFERWEP
jgi:predicted nucleic acid-binding protein